MNRRFPIRTRICHGSFLILSRSPCSSFAIGKAFFETGCRNTRTQREQVNRRHLQEIHLLALRAGDPAAAHLDRFQIDGPALSFLR